MSACKLQVVRRSQRLGENLPHGFNWTLQFSRKWQPFHPFATDVAIVPRGAQTGLQYRAETGGQSAQYADSGEPEWPTIAGKKISDGSITWVAEAVDVDSLEERIDTSTWDTPTGVDVEISEEAEDNEAGKQRTGCMLRTNDTGVFEIENEVLTTLGREYIGKIILTVE